MDQLKLHAETSLYTGRLMNRTLLEPAVGTVDHYVFFEPFVYLHTFYNEWSKATIPFNLTTLLDSPKQALCVGR